MENAKDDDELSTIFKEDDVRKSVGHRGAHFVMDARKRFRAIRDDTKPVANRGPETISQVDRDVVVVADGSG